MVVVLVGDLRSFEEPTVVLTVSVLLRPCPQSLTGLIGVTFSGADRPLAQSYGLPLRGSGNAHEGTVEAEEVDAEVLVQEPEEFVVDAVVTGAVGGSGFVRWVR